MKDDEGRSKTDKDGQRRSETTPRLHPVRWSWVVLDPNTLLGFCYMTIAHAIASREPLATCDECQRVFVVDDARQKFCNPKCAGRARFRRFKTNQTVKTTKTTSKKRRS